jgi:hypothetical protein
VKLHEVVQIERRQVGARACREVRIEDDMVYHAAAVLADARASDAVGNLVRAASSTSPSARDA